jgi:D-alanyl-D-alanine carboxypeptidase
MFFTLNLRKFMQSIVKSKLLIIGVLASGLIFSATQSNAKYASLVIDAKTGELLHAVNENTRNYPASLTKLMTLYLLFEAIEQKKVGLSSRLVVSRKAANRPASKLGLKSGELIKVSDAIMAIIIKSANDVASVIAESIGGSERRFALQMTAKARKLGMSRTTFRNASGLPHRGQMSTAKDMAVLTRAIISHFPKYYHLFSRKIFTFKGRTYRTHNKVLKTFKGAEGMKTGYIHASGYNLVTTAKRNGRRIIGVVFGSNTSRARNRHMKKLLNRAFRAGKFSKTAIVAKTSNNRNASTSINKRIWGVQIGAFYTRKPALKLAKIIAKKYASVLSGGHIKVMPLLKSRNRILYRSRILGIGKRNAYQACKILKKYRKPCLTINLHPSTEVASR